MGRFICYTIGARHRMERAEVWKDQCWGEAVAKFVLFYVVFYAAIYLPRDGQGGTGCSPWNRIPY